jgi:hypothetical protein
MTMRPAVRNLFALPWRDDDESEAAGNDASVRRCQGYARLMEADEAGTLATLRRYRDAMATLIDRHDGRIVDTWGDAIIAEFPSVVEAVQCAVKRSRKSPVTITTAVCPNPNR